MADFDPFGREAAKAIQSAKFTSIENQGRFLVINGTMASIIMHGIREGGRELQLEVNT